MKSVLLVGGPRNGKSLQVAEGMTEIRTDNEPRPWNDTFAHSLAVAIYRELPGTPYFLFQGDTSAERPQTWTVTALQPIADEPRLGLLATLIAKAHADVLAAGYVPLPPRVTAPTRRDENGYVVGVELRVEMMGAKA